MALVARCLVVCWLGSGGKSTWQALPGVHTRRFRVARHDRRRHPRVLEVSQSDLDLLPYFLPQPTPTSSDSDLHASTRFLRKSASLEHPPTSSDTRVPISRIRAESGLQD